MNKFIKEKKQFKKLREEITNIYKNFLELEEKENVEAVCTAYVNAMLKIQNYFYEILKEHVRYSNKEQVNYENLQACRRGAIEDAELFARISESDKINELIKSLKKVEGGGEQLYFYKKHKKQLEKWIKNKTPRKKIIKTLELWTGSLGEEAVMQTLYELRVDNAKLFSHILSIHGYSERENRNLNAVVYTVYETLINYYLAHRNKYSVFIDEEQQISISNMVRLKFKDKYVDVNVKLKDCHFTKFGIVIEGFMKGIYELDKDYIIDAMLSVKMSIEDAKKIVQEIPPLTRKECRQKILTMAHEFAEMLSCTQVKVQNKFVLRPDIESVLENVKKFIEVEKLAEEELNVIVDNVSLQNENLNLLFSEINKFKHINNLDDIAIYVKACVICLKANVEFDNPFSISKKDASYIKHLI